MAGLEMGDEGLATHCLTGFRAAELQHPAVERSPAEVVIKTDDAKRLRARYVERVGHQRDGRIVDIAELMLEVVQDRQRRARQRSLTINDFLRQSWVERRSGGHRNPPEVAPIMS